MHLRQNLVHLGGSEAPTGCSVDVAHRPQVQHDGSRRFVVRGFQDKQAVVVPQCPVDFHDLGTEFLGLGLEDRRTLRGCLQIQFARAKRRDIRAIMER